MKRLLFILIIFNLQSIAQSPGGSLEFIENRGQIVDMEGNLRPDILYVGDGGGAKIYLRKGEVSYVMSEVEGLEEIEELEEEIEHEKNEIEKKKKQEKLAALEAKTKLKGHRVDMEFVNANVDGDVSVADPTEGYFNYYLAHCSEGITGVKAYRRVVYENVYQNIDVIFYSPLKKGVRGLSPLQRGIKGDLGGMEYDFVVEPGGNVEDIKLKYKGTDGMEIEDGKLKIKTSLGEIIEEIPEVYQIVNGEKIKIEAAYVLKGNEVSIEVADYDRSKALIIDPWITYYGGSGYEFSRGIATDGSGNVLITGWANLNSTDFPITPGAFQTNLRGGSDAFVVKFNAAGNRLWATYYGGSDDENGFGVGIVTDGSGNVLITSETASTDFPVTAGAFQTSNAGGKDAFVVKFDAAGSRLWATYYGGSDNDYGHGIVTDGNDNVLITGGTRSTDFPITAGAFQTSIAGPFNAFVVKFDAAGNRLWATYYGGGGDWDLGNDIATDGSGNVLITGYTRSTDFPVTPGAFQTSNNAVDYGNAFVMKLDSTGNRLWATYYGGSFNDEGSGIAIDANDNVLITGSTRSTDFPVTAGAFQTSCAMDTGGFCSGDAFVVKLNAAGNQLWATYYGGSNNAEEGFGIAVDGNDNIYIGGDTYSTDFPVTAGAFQTANGAGGAASTEDQYMVKFDPNGNRICGTYLGGMGHDESAHSGATIAVYGEVVYMTGGAAPNYPVTPGAFQTVHRGGSVILGGDAFIAQLCDDCTLTCCPLPTANITPDTGICIGDSLQLVAGATSYYGGTSYSWLPSAGLSNPNIADPIATPTTTTTYIVIISDSCGSDTASVIVSVDDCDTTKNTFFIPNSFSPNDNGKNNDESRAA